MAIRRFVSRIESVAHVPEADQQCEAHGAKTLIGFDMTETLVYTPPRLEVRVTKYPKYACSNHPECGVIQKPRPESLVEGNKYDPSIAAEIITARYGYHLPFYRQQDMFAGSGWVPSRSTLLNIQTAAAECLQPLVKYFADEVRQDSVIGTDDTGVTLLLPKMLPDLDPDSPKSVRIHEVLSQAMRSDAKHVKAKMWAYRGISVPLNVFDFTVSRHRDGPDDFLIANKYQGTILGDCYTGYTGISVRSSENISHAACNAHARRKIFEARHTHPQLVSVLLSFYQELYDIEDRDRGQEAAALLSLRQSEAVGVWQRMREVLDGEQVARLLPKEPLSGAVGYLNNHWQALGLYVSDARIPIDSNETEQAVKTVESDYPGFLRLFVERTADDSGNLCSAGVSGVAATHFSWRRIMSDRGNKVPPARIRRSSQAHGVVEPAAGHNTSRGSQHSHSDSESSSVTCREGGDQ